MSEGHEMQELTTAQPWDPFQLMDRLDEEALGRELEGVPGTDLVYVVRADGHEVVGLSKQGVDECCMALVAQGQVIREEELTHELLGEGEDREALFRVRAARYAVSPDGQEVKLDQVIGVKRQPLYVERTALDLDAKVPGRKHRGRTYRELLADEDGRGYLGWMAESFGDAEVRDFAARILTGEEVATQRSKQLNPHWYEHGAMKAARNARFRLIPGSVRAQVIATARRAGHERVVDAQPGSVRAAGTKAQPVAVVAESASPERDVVRAESPARTGPYAPTEKQVAFFQRLADSPVFSEEERRRALEWLGTKATRQTIKDQIDWLKRQVDTRRNPDAGRPAA